MSRHSSVNFSKYEGAGNDFILIDDRLLSTPPFTAADITALCHRRFGIGADGLILLQPSSLANFRMRIFNSDGKEAESCGNGLRCLGKFLLDLALPPQKTQVELLKQTVEISYVGECVEVDMGVPTGLTLHQKIGEHVVHIINTGVPHAVLFVEDVERAPFETAAPFLRSHPFFQPSGTNVNFASLQSDGSIRVRTFERGVEAETLACGTGACAVAAIARALYQSPNSLRLRFQGGELTISFLGNQIQMAGPARKVFGGAFIL